MPDANAPARIVLKILSGVQSGAEVSLPPGEYMLGSGPDDDIQLIDVSVKSGHARLRLEAAKIEIKGAAGALYSSIGAQTEANDDKWLEVQPLEVVTAGTTRMALGPPTAQWATITEDSHAPSSAAADRSPPKAGFFSSLASLKGLSLPVTLALILLTIGVCYVAFGVDHGKAAREARKVNAIAALRTALDRYSFGGRIKIRQEVDGTIYASGYVDSDVERRAIAQAIAGTAIPVRLRLGVIAVLKSEIAGLIAAENVRIHFTLSSDGVAIFTGVILKKRKLDQFLADLRQNVLGLAKTISKVETADVLLRQIVALAKLSQIDNAVVFRLDGDAIDANGVISHDKIDAWVGFLQAYSKRFSKDIGLRSFVQLENPPGLAQAQPAPLAQPTTPILLGAAGPVGPGVDLDLKKLKSGSFTLDDIFAGAPPKTASLAKPRTIVATARSVAAARLARAPLITPPNAAAPSAILPDPPKSPDPKPKRAVAKPKPPAKVSSNPQPSRQRPAATSRVASGRQNSPSPVAEKPTQKPGARPAVAAAAAAANAPQPKAPSEPIIVKPPKNVLASKPKSAPIRVASASSTAKGDEHTLPALALGRHDVGKMSERAQKLLVSWTRGKLAEAFPTGADQLEAALDRLANQSFGLTTQPKNLSEAAKELFAHKYLPLFALSRETTLNSARQCRRGSRLSVDNLPAALLWLDIMSTTSAVTLANFDIDAQGFILEAALNPAPSGVESEPSSGSMLEAIDAPR